MARTRKFARMALSCLLLMICLSASAAADQVINLAVTGTVTCSPEYTCGSFPTGPLSGTYSLDITTQTVVGAWSFSTPFGVISSNQTGAYAQSVSSAGYIGVNLGINTGNPPFFEYVLLYYPGTDTQQTGTLGPSYACSPITGEEGCYPENTVSGTATALSANFTNFQGGKRTTPIPLPSGSPVAGVAGILGGTGAQNYYQFNWNGGNFQADLSMPSLVGYNDNILYELADAANPSVVIDQYLFNIKKTNEINQFIIADGLNPGAYIIGMQAIESGHGPAFGTPNSTNPGFTITFDTPVNGFITLHSFDATDGLKPVGALVQGTNGNMYGATNQGGASNAGTVFKITPSGTLTTLYNFCSKSGCTDGGYPQAGLVQGTDGDLYGTTAGGGAHNDGIFYRITPSGKLTKLYSFCAQSGCADGKLPEGTLVQAGNGDFYGVTVDGGAYKKGTIYQITASGTLTTLYSFCAQSGCPDGFNPFGGLIQATDGNLYGTTSSGGANNYGTVFQITLSGTLTTLYSFCSQSGCSDGAEPNSGLIQATDGNLYGTTPAFNGGGGTIFRITPSGTLTTFYSFLCTQSGCPGGDGPEALVQSTDGNLYGTTEGGGANGDGTVFQLTLGGALTTLYSFCSQSGCADGKSPSTSLVQGTNGDLYGTTSGDGANGDGTVFTLSAGLGPFVEIVPSSGNVGAAVEILGTNLTGATNVTFNGTTTVFTVISSSEISTSVPVGATTGAVQVVTPSGVLSSNVPFQVP